MRNLTDIRKVSDQFLKKFGVCEDARAAEALPPGVDIKTWYESGCQSAADLFWLLGTLSENKFESLRPDIDLALQCIVEESIKYTVMKPSDMQPARIKWLEGWRDGTDRSKKTATNLFGQDWIETFGRSWLRNGRERGICETADDAVNAVEASGTTGRADVIDMNSRQCNIVRRLIPIWPGRE